MPTLKKTATAVSAERDDSDRLSMTFQKKPNPKPTEMIALQPCEIMFSMFGEDIGLLPQKLFSRMLVGSKNDPGKLSERLAALFGAMATGGDFGADEILWFNGGLFADSEVIELRPAEIEELIRVNEHDWADVEPSIFGTLFTLSYFAVDYVDWPASRRGLGFRDRVALFRANTSSMLGFGAGVWFLLLVPFVNLFFMPAAVAGGTRLFLELEARRHGIQRLPEEAPALASAD